MCQRAKEVITRLLNCISRYEDEVKRAEERVGRMDELSLFTIVGFVLSCGPPQQYYFYQRYFTKEMDDMFINALAANLPPHGDAQRSESKLRSASSSPACCLQSLGHTSGISLLRGTTPALERQTCYIRLGNQETRGDLDPTMAATMSWWGYVGRHWNGCHNNF
ncbi:hypothetical protein Salat_2918100 [Sesamum alatum]|uniref:Uncharacterized protein n=1 Tax=Sesamum alatum TaxID=300844 RepID=A0AAE1XJV0_9LAMI|nr:hypothetical protein Salat_2918100 [Sesamum alatum]